MTRHPRLGRGIAGTALTTAVSLLTGLAYALPAQAADPLPDNGAGARITFGQGPRADRCEVGHALHIGGAAVKAAASKALGGTDADLAAALFRKDNLYPSPLDDALRADRASAVAYVQGADTRKKGWEALNRPYAMSATGSTGMSLHAPEFDAGIRAFTLDTQEALYDTFGQDGRSAPSAASLDAARRLAASLKGKSPAGDDQLADFMLYPSNVEGPFNSTTSSDVARYLRQGGFPAQAPTEGSPEYRTEVETLKVSWAGCDSWNPDDPRRVLAPVTASAYAEWEAEYAGQAKPRADISAAETTAAAQAQKATDAMIESIGQAWLADQILTWQKFWAGKPANDPNRPAKALFTQAGTDLTKARDKAAAQVTLANAAVTAAKTAADKAAAAQTSAYAIADTAKTPRGRGLLYAQQSAQVVKASYAATQAAAKATLTALNAAKATAADSKAQLALSQTQAHAINTEFRRAAAEEAAAQAKAAADAADAQAKEAAANAAKAKAAQTTAEAAEKTAQSGAATAKAARATAEAASATAKAEHANATRERGKAQAAETRAQQDAATAATARSAADSSGATAAAGYATAIEAQQRAYAAKTRAQDAQRDKQAALSRAAALEAAAAAAEGTAAAQETRAAATEARSAANTATTAAASAQQEAATATTAAVAARAASVRADAAAYRSESAAQTAQAAAQTTHAAAVTAHAAAATAIEASKAAQKNAENAEAEAKKAAAAAVTARTQATAARDEANKTASWAAVTAGYAYAAAEHATAARDSAAEVIKPANEAINIGTAYKEVDSSAAYAVLIGQTALTLAEQQAAAAKAKSDDAAKAAATAKALADKAAADAKAAATAASAAAADAARAAAAVTAARASAAAAAKSAEAAKKADANAQAYDAQAGADASAAQSAAYTARSEANAADGEATEAERDAAGARSAAQAAENDAASARATATEAESDATGAEAAAKDAQGSAKDADTAADAAEEEYRKRIEADRASTATGTPDSGPGLNASDEALLLKECGQSCVDDYRAAKALASLDVIDWVKQNGADILLEFIGEKDLKRCLGSGDVESCLWTIVNGLGLVFAVGKIPQLSKAIVKVSSGIAKFLDDVVQAKHTLDRLRKLLETLKKGQTVAQCLLSLADATVGFAPAASRSSLAAAAPAKFCMKSAIGKDKRLTNLAELSTKNEKVQADLNALFRKLMEGNLNPGISNGGLSNGISYARTRDGARLFYRKLGDTIEIVGKSDKKYEDKVIARLKEIYGN
ncbi:hypothetical protein [Streptomyces acidiscabies]|uniref:Methyl-accepting transducer domain-containing protein n=5 Tax=Streptomyces acidiscabies TaxID=42234 RepID=A0AAP6EJV1_9ACTN|nr:hypothetical protein [Streptomyces acidiscabies]MDX2964910.1 hypothetical protein [Streptomyces acidiscabies]MDX3793008.1 hypothetical protein [Streptomyces acidiscabies]GAV45219.1 hypothetical protein Saa2_08206 [Streptomyces acidiscabies]